MPKQQTFQLDRKGQTKNFAFEVTPPANQNEGFLKAIVNLDGQIFDKELITIDYNHIPFQSVLLPSEVKIVRLDIEKKGQNVGYINGAGDAIPESLR